MVSKKKLFALFFLVGLLYFLPEDWSLTSDKEEKSIVIQVTDKESQNIDSVIVSMLALQKSLLASPNPAKLTWHQQKKGFLLFTMSPEYVKELIVDKNAKIIGAYHSDELIGYILLTEISEFKRFYQNPKIGFLESPLDQEYMGNLLAQENIQYIEQIAVNLNRAKSGIGRSLITRSKEIAPDGLIADVFIEPVSNQASLTFFSKMGFKEIAVLHGQPRPDIGAHKKCVFFWSNEALE